jgi:hypothetical protein
VIFWAPGLKYRCRMAGWSLCGCQHFLAGRYSSDTVSGWICWSPQILDGNILHLTSNFCYFLLLEVWLTKWHVLRYRTAPLRNGKVMLPTLLPWNKLFHTTPCITFNWKCSMWVIMASLCLHDDVKFYIVKKLYHEQTRLDMTVIEWIPVNWGSHLWGKSLRTKTFLTIYVQLRIFGVAA